MLFDDLTCSESEFQGVGTATEKTRVAADNKWKPNKRIQLALGAREGYPQEIVW